MALKLLLFLFAGAIINVAVAWGTCFAQRTLLYDAQHTTRLRDAYAKLRAVSPNPDSVLWPKAAYEGLGVTRLHFEASDSFIFCDAIGWPCTTFQGSHSVHYARLPGSPPIRKPEEALMCQHQVMLTTDPEGGSGAPSQGAIPLQLSAPGFAINTIFYAAMVWGLFAAFGSSKRRWRLNRGVCPLCIYPIGTSENCSECGTVVKTRR